MPLFAYTEEKCRYDRMQNHPPGISATLTSFDGRHASNWISPCQLVPTIAFWHGKFLIFCTLQATFDNTFLWCSVFYLKDIMRLPTIYSSQSYLTMNMNTSCVLLWFKNKLPSTMSHRFPLHPFCARRASDGISGTIGNDNHGTGNKTNEHERTNVTVCSYQLNHQTYSR